MAGPWQPALGDRQLRQLAWAVLASLVLHLLLLYALPMLKEARKQLPAKPLTARLAEQKPKPLEPLPLAEPAPPVKPQARKPESRAAIPEKPVPRPDPAPPVISVEPARTAPEPALTVPAAPAAASSPPSPAAGAPKSDSVAATAPAAPDYAGTLAQYRLEIMDLARRYKRYPRLAVDNNWEGRVEVRMVIGAGGAIASLSVKTSAGYEALDQEALAMLRRAKAAAAIPPALRGREFTLEVPVIFSLKDAGSG